MEDFAACRGGVASEVRLALEDERSSFWVALAEVGAAHCVPLVGCLSIPVSPSVAREDKSEKMCVAPAGVQLDATMFARVFLEDLDDEMLAGGDRVLSEMVVIYPEL